MSFVALNFKKWIDENRHLLKPPVGNQMVWPLDKTHREFIVMVVGGPNQRADYHVNESEEYFHQIEGDITLRVLENGKPHDITLREGDIFLLPPRVPHSPQRPAGTVGLVIERRRKPQEIDTFLWICDGCHARLHAESLHLTDIVTQLPPIFERFWNNPQHTTCGKCGQKHSKNNVKSHAKN